ncbi:hypothetical protein FA15DRAFT_119519 [Coprinopsis marcescibilis]|uniref:Uncharacterized protein n=1 Tax=Coprinopsis marcescibilis TaxID=230819 RepID=A0A5C3L579_COPMA|nr:hypothetical protein FA15DRAFT_119519 [Coprinopsis marcescibilis]
MWKSKPNGTDAHCLWPRILLDAIRSQEPMLVHAGLSLHPNIRGFVASIRPEPWQRCRHTRVQWIASNRDATLHSKSSIGATSNAEAPTGPAEGPSTYVARHGCEALEPAVNIEPFPPESTTTMDLGQQICEFLTSFYLSQPDSTTHCGDEGGLKLEESDTKTIRFPLMDDSVWLDAWQKLMPDVRDIPERSEFEWERAPQDCVATIREQITVTVNSEYDDVISVERRSQGTSYSARETDQDQDVPKEDVMADCSSGDSGGGVSVTGAAGIYTSSRVGTHRHRPTPTSASNIEVTPRCGNLYHRYCKYLVQCI